MDSEVKKGKKWLNIVCVLRQSHGNFSDVLTNDSLRIRLQFLCVFVIFAAVSAVMTLVNGLTGWGALRNITGLFAVLNLVNVALVLISKKTEIAAQFLFSIEILCLFTYFLISGEPEGFSAVWIALLPTCGLLLYRLKNGIIVSAVQLVVLLFLFWTPVGRTFLVYDYTESFLLRFPLLYVAFFVVGIFFEFIRHTTQKELAISRYNFEQLSKHDPLTKLYNRLGFYSTIGEGSRSSGASGDAFAIVDFDSFKTINDTRGHSCGDLVLRDTSALITEIIGDNGCVCRWGGDEISIYFFAESNAEKLCNDLLRAIREHTFTYAGKTFHITVSIGLILVAPDTQRNIEELIYVADTNLYVSKGNGKDRLMVSRYTPGVDMAPSENI